MFSLVSSGWLLKVYPFATNHCSLVTNIKIILVAARPVLLHCCIFVVLCSFPTLQIKLHPWALFIQDVCGSVVAEKYSALFTVSAIIPYRQRSTPLTCLILSKMKFVIQSHAVLISCQRESDENFWTFIFSLILIFFSLFLLGFVVTLRIIFTFFLEISSFVSSSRFILHLAPYYFLSPLYICCLCCSLPSTRLHLPFLPISNRFMPTCCLTRPDKNPYAWHPIGLARGYTPPKNTRVASDRVSTCVSPPWPLFNTFSFPLKHRPCHEAVHSTFI